MHNAPPVILINGWPGVGKNTVAECLGLLLGTDKAAVVANDRRRPLPFHGPAAFLPPYDHPDHARDPKGARAAVLAHFIESPGGLSRIPIFTDCQPDTADGRAAAQAYEAACARAGRLLVPVCLLCTVEENERRLQTLERRTSQRDTIRSPKEARAVRARGGGALFAFPGRPGPGLALNVTEMAPHETAVRILAFMNELLARRDRELEMEEEEATPVESREPDWERMGAS